MFSSNNKHSKKTLGNRKIQVELDNAFNHTTDRTSLRTDSIFDWFYMNWELKGITDFVQNMLVNFIDYCNNDKSGIQMFDNKNKNYFKPLIQKLEMSEFTPRTKYYDELKKLDFNNEINLFSQESCDIFDF